jgi:hypothetical protein
MARSGLFFIETHGRASQPRHCLNCDLCDWIDLYDGSLRAMSLFLLGVGSSLRRMRGKAPALRSVFPPMRDIYICIYLPRPPCAVRHNMLVEPSDHPPNPVPLGTEPDGAMPRYPGRCPGLGYPAITGRRPYGHRNGYSYRYYGRPQGSPLQPSQHSASPVGAYCIRPGLYLFSARRRLQPTSDKGQGSSLAFLARRA